MEPALSIKLADFVKRRLPVEFQDPLVKPVREMSGVSAAHLTDLDWVHAWKIHGECSDWVLKLLEAHASDVPIEHVGQFLHFITNPLMLGNQSILFFSGFIRF